MRSEKPRGWGRAPKGYRTKVVCSQEAIPHNVHYTISPKRLYIPTPSGIIRARSRAATLGGCKVQLSPWLSPVGRARDLPPLSNCSHLTPQRQPPQRGEAQPTPPTAGRSPCATISTARSPLKFNNWPSESAEIHARREDHATRNSLQELHADKVARRHRPAEARIVPAFCSPLGREDGLALERVGRRIEGHSFESSWHAVEH